MASPKKPEVPADLTRVGDLLVEASKVSHHKEFVVIGSLSVLASTIPPPSKMLMSVDVDFYPLLDPGRAGDIARALGPDSNYAEKHGLYADAVSPSLPALPDGWESRLRRVEHPQGVIGLYLDPDDCAVAKLARSERRDQQWVLEGIRAGLIDPFVVQRRMGTAPFLDMQERRKAEQSLRMQAELGGRPLGD